MHAAHVVDAIHRLSRQFEEGCDTLAAAYAHGLQPQLRVPALHFVEHGGEDPGPGGRDEAWPRDMPEPLTFRMS